MGAGEEQVGVRLHTESALEGMAAAEGRQGLTAACAWSNEPNCNVIFVSPIAFAPEPVPSS